MNILNRITLSRDKGLFLRTIVQCRNELQPTCLDDPLIIVFDDSFTESNILPFHLVLFSCLIEDILKYGYEVEILFSNSNLESFLSNETNFAIYWSKDRPAHCPSPNISRLNLWRIVENEKETYSNSVYEYFKREYFEKYDLSALHNTLNELYFNVFDHAEANGNAFSYIHYDVESRKISIAVCDFGRGVAYTLNKAHSYKNDCEALENSLKRGVSARTKPHNRGFGLDSVVNSLGENDNLKVISNSALLVCTECGKSLKTYDLKFVFEGTFIYFEISIDSFEEEEVFNCAKLN